MIRITPPVHPGEILREDYLLPLGITPYALAKAIDVPRTRIERLVHEKTPITTDTALRLGRYFSTTPDVWMNLQIAYELAHEIEAHGAEIEKISPLVVAA